MEGIHGHRRAVGGVCDGRDSRKGSMIKEGVHGYGKGFRGHGRGS